MTLIYLNESSASSRCVPIWCVQSNGTSAATNEATGVFSWGMGGVSWGTGGTLSALSAGDGSYSANFRASVLSLPGQGVVFYSSATALPASSPFNVVGFSPWTTPVTMPSDPASASAISAGISAITAALSVLTTGQSLSSATLAVILTSQSLSSATLAVILTSQSNSSATLSVLLGYASDSSASLAAIRSATSSIATAGQTAQAVISAASTNPIVSRLSMVNNVVLQGSGTTADPWRPV